jgi:hypothetical protein
MISMRHRFRSPTVPTIAQMRHSGCRPPVLAYIQSTVQSPTHPLTGFPSTLPTTNARYLPEKERLDPSPTLETTYAIPTACVLNPYIDTSRRTVSALSGMVGAHPYVDVRDDSCLLRPP